MQEEKCPACLGAKYFIRPAFPGLFKSRCPACHGQGEMSSEELAAYIGSAGEKEYLRMRKADGNYIGILVIAVAGVGVMAIVGAIALLLRY